MIEKDKVYAEVVLRYGREGKSINEHVFFDVKVELNSTFIKIIKESVTKIYQTRYLFELKMKE